MKMPLRRCESGTSMIEFALVLPVLVFLLIGLIEVGRYTFFSILAANAARAGAQYGMQDPSHAQDTSGMQTAALNDGQNLSQFSVPTAKCQVSVSGGALGDCSNSSVPTAGTVYYVKVTVTGTFKSLLSYPGIPTNVPVTGSAVMRVMNQ
jgi:Flp pilus assembly protein TadG